MFKRALVVFAAVLTAAWGSSAWPQKDVRWGTSAVGSTGHKALVVLAEVLNREMKEYRVTVQPTGGAVITMKGHATGEFDGYYGSDIGFYEYANDTQRFKGFKASAKRPLVQSLWTFTIEVGAAVHSKNRGKYKGWVDLNGKSVFTGLPPWDVRAHLERAFNALGVKHQYRQVDLSAAGSLLQGGGLDGFILYTSGETAPAPWITEASLAADWAALNPSAEELAKLKQAGFAVIEVKPDVFRKDVHADKVVLLPFYYGFHVGLEIPGNDVYRMLTIIEKNLGELVKSDPGYAQIAKDMSGFQRLGVLSSVDFVPIHPGLAKYMREKGVWDAKWDARVAK